MNNNKNIDDLFKERLQSFEADPSPDVWNNIQAQLKKEKEDRKVIPIWWKLAGVAAVLALLLIGNAVFDPFGNSTTPTLVEGNPDTERSIEAETTPVFEEQSKEGTISNKEVEDQNSEDRKAEFLNNPSKSKESTIAKETDVLIPDTEKTFKPSVEEYATQQSQKEAVAATTSKTIKETPLIKGNPALNNGNETSVSEKIQTAVASENVEKNTSENPTHTQFKTNISENNKLNNNKAVALDKEVKELPKNDAFQNDKTIVPNNGDVKEAVAQITPQEDKTEENKKSIFDAIEEDKETAVAKLDEKDLKNWEVTPNFGPVFYNSLDGGSSIDPSFADNVQNSETNFSYGVQISYAVNSRLRIRSGVSNVNLGYTTEGLELATGPSTAGLQSINYGAKQTVTTAVDRGSFDTPPPTNGMNPFNNLNPKSTGGNATLTQNLSYYEIPLELNYSLVDARFGVAMIGGISTLLLGNNEVVANDGDFREVLGGANNLNDVSFSTNVGLGFHYKISKKLKFNIEPMFKYQLNPYTDSSVDFRPYYLGVYSGLSFKF